MGGNNRYRGRWELPPITLGDLRPAAIPVIVRCPACKRSATLAATDLPLSGYGICGRPGRPSGCRGAARSFRQLKSNGDR